MLRAATGRVALVLAAVLVATTGCSETPRGETDLATGEAGGTSGPLAAPIRGEDLVDLLGTGAVPLLLDVRSREEFAEGHIPGALNIPYDELPGRLAELADHRDEEIVVYCRSGRRAKVAEETLAGAGFANVRDLTGHMIEWKEARRPVTEAVPCC